MAAPSRTERVELANIAEREIQKHADDNVLWIKNILGIDLDPIQTLKMELMDEHFDTVDVSARRTRKTTAKELHTLKRLAVEPNHEHNVVAPKEDQSKESFKIIAEAVRRSPVLSAYLRWKDGKRQLSDMSLEFNNYSRSRCFGITSNLDGINSTIADVEECDDLDEDRLRDRFLLTRLGTETLFSQGTKTRKSVRITGVYKGAGLLEKFANDENYFLLPTIDVWMGVAMGIIDRRAVETDMVGMTDDMILRSLLCKATSAKNFFHERHLRRMMTRGNMRDLSPAVPMPGEIYKPRAANSVRGLFLDIGGHGESDHPSRYAATALEFLDNNVFWLYGRDWEATTSKELIVTDMVDLWDYFRPSEKICYGDAYGAAIISDICDALFERGLVRINRRHFAGSSATAWANWPMIPIRMDGFMKHAAYTYAQQWIHSGRVFAPLVTDQNRLEPEYAALEKTIEQLKNIRSKKTSHNYDSYQMVKKAIGDDYADTWGLGFFAFGANALLKVPTIIDSASRTRDSILHPGDRFRIVSDNGLQPLEEQGVKTPCQNEAVA